MTDDVLSLKKKKIFLSKEKKNEFIQVEIVGFKNDSRYYWNSCWSVALVQHPQRPIYLVWVQVCVLLIDTVNNKNPNVIWNVSNHAIDILKLIATHVYSSRFFAFHFRFHFQTHNRNIYRYIFTSGPSSLPSSHCGIPSQALYTAMQSPEWHWNWNRLQCDVAFFNGAVIAIKMHSPMIII